MYRKPYFCKPFRKICLPLYIYKSINLLKKLSKIGALFLFIIMTFGIMKNGVLYTMYQYDKDLFVEVFCENKNQPESSCEGQCQIEKIASEEDHQQDLAQVFKGAQAEVLYYHTDYYAFKPLSYSPLSQSFSFPIAEEVYCADYLSKLIKPPRIFS